MYAPLLFMEYVQDCFTDFQCKEGKYSIQEYAYSVIDDEIGSSVLAACSLFSNHLTSMFRKDIRDTIKHLIKRVQDGFLLTGYQSTLNLREFANWFLHVDLHRKWSHNKRVYKVTPELMKSLSEMEPPKQIPLTMYLTLPSYCFYIDFSGAIFPGTNDIGVFVNVIRNGQEFVFDMTLLQTDSRYAHKSGLYTVLPARALQPVENISNDDIVKVEANNTYQSYHRFLINFLCYLTAANNDVEVTERTRKVYRPIVPGTKPKNKMSEVEEIGVGFRYTTLHKSKVRVTYVGGEENHTPRKYASNWRSAHWHSYWINDPENPGNKKLIRKYIPETYVHGNYTIDTVQVTKVTK